MKRVGMLRAKARPNTELKRFREARHLSQAKLAELAGCGQGDIAKLETGAKRTTAEWSLRLAPPLGVTPRELFPSIDDHLRQRDIVPSGNAALDPEKLRHAMAIARKMAEMHGAENQEAAIAGLAATIYDVLAECEDAGQIVSNSVEGLALIEAVLKRVWRP